ncbi:MAG: large conductance mechanosensitive channel protein MscL [Amoebophilaceae bacterium]|nr:large conductance mechanosensitive channel protein MscL [Amoebophilaceae bacterium]
MKKFLEEFKQFALRGNVIELGVGIVIGGAFNNIVSSLVHDIIMPCVGLLVGGVNFTALKIDLKAATELQPDVTLNIGVFIQSCIHLFIIALSVFTCIKLATSLYKPKENKP